MDLTTITMEPDEAQKAYLAYRQAVRDSDEPSAEDEAIMRGYRELARGSRLINLRETIAAGGVDDNGLPRLAVMRADVPWCWISRGIDGSVRFLPRWWVDGRTRRGVYDFDAGTLPSAEWRPGWSGRYRAMVPIIPPALRPRWKLANYEVLWEATWEQVPRPPGDPALLKHIGGELYAVLAVWDLTDLERAVLAGRSVGA